MTDAIPVESLTVKQLQYRRAQQRRHAGVFQVYVLSDPVTDELRYVGVTILKLGVRLMMHCRPAALRVNDYRTRWVKTLLDRGLRPKIELLEEHPTKEAMLEAEEFWITQFRALGFRLVNTAPGGQGYAWPKGKPRTPEAVEKVASQLRGRKQDPEVVARRRAAARGVRKPPRTREHSINNALAQGGRPFTDETGAIFYLIKDAAAAHGIHYSTVHRGLKGRPTKGHKFTYIEGGN